MRNSRLIALLLVLVVAAPATAQTGGTPRKYLLERVDDAAIVQLYADGFAALPLREKTLIYHLTQAAIAGRDIFFDQKHRDALAMRAAIERIVARPQGIEAATLAEVRRYAKLFWINNGPYHNLTAQKFVLKLTPAQWLAAAAQAGVDEREARRLQPMLLDPAIDPVVTNKNPPAGQDILTASANNLYSGVSMTDLKGFTEKYGLNSRLVKENGRLEEEVYRLGGRYDAQIREIVRHLEAAIPFASAPTANALRALIQWYRTGEDADRIKYDIAWVEDKASSVDTINGFIEVYLDPRGIKGSWEGIVFYVNQEKTGRIRTLADNAQWFEDRMPWDPKFRKPNVQGIVANAIDVVVETGDAGPVSAVGINLPNDNRIRQQHGSKSVSLSNIREAADNATPGTTRNEFSWTPEEAARAARHGSFAAEMHTNMHEVIGHASGQQAPTLKGTPQEALKEYASALEEARADLVALYFIADPKLGELGVIDASQQQEVARTQYESYTRQALTQLLRVGRNAAQLEQDHMRNRQMVVHWLMANTKAIERRTRDGKTFYVMTDAQAFREGAGRLLAEVQRIKGEGDYAAAAKLFQTYGVRFDPKLRDEVIARTEKLNPAAYTGFVMPKLEPVTGAGGTITDVRISYPMDLTSQMLEWSRARAD